MLLWLCFALLTAAIVALLLRPLRHAPAAAVEPVAADLAVYRDQLRELEAEHARGLIPASEVESARTEVARRLLKRAHAPDAPAASAPAAAADDEARSFTRARRIYAAIAALLPALAITLYLASGSPHLPSRPFGERQSAEAKEPNVANLVARVEERLREHPEDGRGWDVIAPVYLRLGRYADAAHAFAEANRLEGESVRRLLGFAEASLLAGNGIVSEPVRKAALRVLELEPGRIEVRVWLALAKEQDGDLAGAAAEYRDILAKAPADASWRAAVTDRLDQLEKKRSGAPAADTPAPASPAPAPQAEAPPPAAAPGGMPDIAAMSPAERDAFIAGMVDRLAARLKENGKDLEGWLRLARAYKVMGREDDARGALRSARANFTGDSASLEAIARSEQSLGLRAEEQANPQ